jgi:hypothetical protein
MLKLERSYLIKAGNNSINYVSASLVIIIFCLVILPGCNSGKIPCPKIGNKRGLAFFKKKADPTIPNQEGFGQSKSVGYDKNGLMKKKKYNNLKHKPKRTKLV